MKLVLVGMVVVLLVFLVRDVSSIITPLRFLNMQLTGYGRENCAAAETVWDKKVLATFSQPIDFTKHGSNSKNDISALEIMVGPLTRNGFMQNNLSEGEKDKHLADISVTQSLLKLFDKSDPCQLRDTIEVKGLSPLDNWNQVNFHAMEVATTATAVDNNKGSGNSTTNSTKEDM